MLIKKILRPLMMFIPVFVFAQQNKTQAPILYGVFYDYKHVYNLSRPQDTVKDQTLLLFNDESSRFLSYQKLGYAVSVYKQYNSELRMSSSNQPIQYRMPLAPRCFLPEHYFYFNDQKHIVHDFLGKAYLYEDEFPSISWEFINQEKEILGLTAMKAKAYYKGRDWEVWYTEEIPVPAGPWELNGLPGLIVEATDLTGEIHFTVRSISPYQDLADDEILAYYVHDGLQLPNKYVEKINRKDFLKILELARKDRGAILNNFGASMGSNTPLYLHTLTTMWTRNLFPNPIAK